MSLYTAALRFCLANTTFVLASFPFVYLAFLWVARSCCCCLNALILFCNSAILAVWSGPFLSRLEIVEESELILLLESTSLLSISLTSALCLSALSCSYLMESLRLFTSPSHWLSDAYALFTFLFSYSIFAGSLFFRAWVDSKSFWIESRSAIARDSCFCNSAINCCLAFNWVVRSNIFVSAFRASVEALFN